MKLLLQLDTSNVVNGEEHLAVLVYLLTLWDSTQSEWTFAFVRLPAPLPGYQQVYLRAANIRSQTMQGDGSTRPGGSQSGPRTKNDAASSWQASSSTWASHGISGAITWHK